MAAMTWSVKSTPALEASWWSADTRLANLPVFGWLPFTRVVKRRLNNNPSVSCALKWKYNMVRAISAFPRGAPLTTVLASPVTEVKTAP